MRYPTRNGLIIPPYELGFTCPEVYKKGVTNNHHAYFYKERYLDSSVSDIFANLLDNVFMMYIDEHTFLHDRYDPPKKPDTTLMIDVIEEQLATNGVIHHVTFKRTHTIHTVTAEQWNSIKRRSSCRTNN